LSGQRIIQGAREALRMAELEAENDRLTRELAEARAAIVRWHDLAYETAKRRNETQVEINRVRDALRQARDLIADQLEAPRHLATIDTALAAPSAGGGNE
jgi:hypothetical protein